VRPHQALGYLTPLEFLRGARREANASRPNRTPRAGAPGSRVAIGDEQSEPALDPGAPRAPYPPLIQKSVTYVLNEYTRLPNRLCWA